MERVWHDLRFALRSLIKSPSFSIIAIVTLSLGIASTTSIFSVVNAVVLQPLPYPESDRLYHVGTAMTDGRATAGGLSPFALSRMKEQSTSFEDFAGAFQFEVSIQDPTDRPLKTLAFVVSDGFFDVFRTNMAVGRGFVPEEHIEVRGATAAPSVVISHRLWQSAFASDPNIAGSSIAAGAMSLTVVGVAPPDFDYPAGADIWIAFDPGTEVTAVYLDGVGRLAPGSSGEQGATELTMLASRFEQESPSFQNRTIFATGLKEWVVGDTSTTLVILLAAASTLLLIACANVMTLLLSRGGGRSREIALRAALGAGRWRLAQQLMTESLVLAAVGALVGLAGTRLALTALSMLGPDELPRMGEVGIDPSVLLFTLLITGMTGVLFGSMPAARLLRADIKTLMGGSARGASGARGGGIFNVLVLGTNRPRHDPRHRSRTPG